MQKLQPLQHSFNLVTGLTVSPTVQINSMDNYQNHALSKIRTNAFTPMSHQLIQLQHHHLHAQQLVKDKNHQPMHQKVMPKKIQPSFK